MIHRLAHITDPHETEGQRFLDAKACNDWAVEDAIAANCTIFGLTGDFNGTTDVGHKPTTLEQNTWDVRFQRCANHAPVIILYGNHDGPGTLEGYGRLAATNPIIVVSQPQVIDLAQDDEGRWLRESRPGGVRIFALPYPWKTEWLTRFHGASIEEKDAAIEHGLRELLLSWHDLVVEARARDIATIFLGHIAIRGYALAGGETLAPGGELTVGVSDLQALDCDYSGVGHIHLCQEMASKIHIAGSVGRSNFGETDPKGYLLVDVAAGRLPGVHRRLTPARPFITIQATWSLDTGAGLPGWIMDQPAAIDGAEVRVLVTIPEEALGTCDPDELKDVLRARGAIDVFLTKKTDPKMTLRCPAIVEAERLEDQLVAYWDMLGETGPDANQRLRCLDLFADVQRDAALAEAA
jgi:hypothetical protein